MCICMYIYGEKKTSARKRCRLFSECSKIAIPSYIKSSAVAGNCVKCTEQQQQKSSCAEALPSKNLQKERKRTQVRMLSQASYFWQTMSKLHGVSLRRGH